MSILGYSKQERVVAFGVLAGVVLTIIGIRFLIWPQSGAYTFGLKLDGANFALHYVIGLRDVWLGVLVIFSALTRSFGPLSQWFLIGAVVCLFDAAIVVAFGGIAAAIVFHLLSGVFCALVGLGARSLVRAA